MLYDFMISVANHSIAEWTAEKLNIDIVFEPGDSDSDVEVRMMGTVGEISDEICDQFCEV